MSNVIKFSKRKRRTRKTGPVEVGTSWAAIWEELFGPSMKAYREQEKARRKARQAAFTEHLRTHGWSFEREKPSDKNRP